jgi:hypothetical protein
MPTSALFGGLRRRSGEREIAKDLDFEYSKARVV